MLNCTNVHQRPSRWMVEGRSPACAAAVATLWWSLLTVVDRWIRRRRKRRLAGTTLEAKESLPMRERSSLLVADLLTNQHLMIAVISCNLVGGG